MSVRHRELLNNNWSFMYGDIMEAKEEGYDDSDWYTVGIPHSFGIPYFMENDFYVGYGCYRKTITIKREWIGRKLMIEFQAAFQDAEIYVNGQLAGSHQGGYTAFPIDISPFVRDGDNLLFVRLNNNWNPRLAPRAGEHVFNGGIYRDVSLIVTDPVHVAWYGTFVTTPSVSHESAELDIRTELVNEDEEAVDCRLVSVIVYDGVAVAETSEILRLEPGETVQAVHRQSVVEPRLWHPDTPRLYRLVSRVYRGGLLCDEYETSFGIRWFRFDAKEGFFLNGEHYDITGANVHQDHAGWGDAVTRAGIARDIRMIKECGMNFIRGAHYPHHTSFAGECDRQGVLFWSELCFWGIGGANTEGYWTSSAYPVREEDKPGFEESCLQTLGEMIRTNRNHPSVIVWSMSNEPFFSEPEVMDDAKALVVRLVEESRRLDPSRPAAVGGAQRQGFDALGDLAGYNGDGAALYIDPGFPSLVSEYGSAISDRPGEYAPRFTDGVESNPRWRSGKALWCGFHHGSIAFDMGHMGMIDYYRLPLNTWYWYRKELRGIDPPPPSRNGEGRFLCLSADKLEIGTDGTDDTHITVTIVDADGHRVDAGTRVKLVVAEGGGLFPTGRSLDLSADQGSLLDGMGAIELRSYYSGTIVVRAEAEGLVSAELVIEAVGGEPWNGQRLNWQIAPPSRMKEPKLGEASDIARSRPVFCSSYAEGHSSMNVTDGDELSCWKPKERRSGEWILVDLEGRKPANCGIISFAEDEAAAVVYELSYSYNGSRYMPVHEDRLTAQEKTVSFELPSAGLRYLKLRFPGAPAAVANIRILS